MLLLPSEATVVNVGARGDLPLRRCGRTAAGRGEGQAQNVDQGLVLGTVAAVLGGAVANAAAAAVGFIGSDAVADRLLAAVADKLLAAAAAAAAAAAGVAAASAASASKFLVREVAVHGLQVEGAEPELEGSGLAHVVAGGGGGESGHGDDAAVLGSTQKSRKWKRTCFQSEIWWENERPTHPPRGPSSASSASSASRSNILSLSFYSFEIRLGGRKGES